MQKCLRKKIKPNFDIFYKHENKFLEFMKNVFTEFFTLSMLRVTPIVLKLKFYTNEFLVF